MSPPRVLIVDDEPGLRLSIAANLELEGFEVVEAGSGREALALLEEPRVDLVLTDVRMPGMDGVELFREIRKRHPAMPVLLMTAFALEGMVQGALREGAFALISKPFAIDHLVAALSAAARSPLVLVVDDAAPLADVTAGALRAVGLSATSASDAEEAIRVVQEGSVDVCVVDLVMPRTDGAALILRIHEVNRAIACIAVSGYDTKEMLRRVVSHVHAFLRKPLDPGDLAETIARARGRVP